MYLLDGNDTCFDRARCTCSQPAAFLNQRTCIMPSTYVCTSFVSDLVLVKSTVVGKASRQSLLLITYSMGRILHGNVAIIMKPSPLFPVHDVVMVPGLLPIFLQGWRINSRSGLVTRLLCRCRLRESLITIQRRKSMSSNLV